MYVLWQLWLDIYSSKIGAYLRLTFPSLQQTSSPLTVLPQFLEVLGRKIDNCEDVLVPSLLHHVYI